MKVYEIHRTSVSLLVVLAFVFSIVACKSTEEQNEKSPDYPIMVVKPGSKTLETNYVSVIKGKQNVEAPTGTLGADAENMFQYVLKYRGRNDKEEDFESLILKSLPNGEVLRLKDVADVELGSLSYNVKNGLFIPLAVILSVPFGLAGSFLFAKIFGIENNIYMQTGVIMLIGLLSKTAILLTEYASERRKQGMSITAAAMSVAKVRLRPILMTSLTMIFGLMPMVFASGVGSNGSRSLGVGTIGGMLVGTIALLFIVPVLFIVFQSIEERAMPGRHLAKQADSINQKSPTE